MAVVLHGGATKAALSDAAYKNRFGKLNPNTALLRELKSVGVEFLVCGQALTHQGFRVDEVGSEVRVALSAATAIINRQMQGYAYLPLH